MTFVSLLVEWTFGQIILHQKSLINSTVHTVKASNLSYTWLMNCHLMPATSTAFCEVAAICALVAHDSAH